MDQEQQRLVRASFAKVAPIADTAAAMFYERLFATDPTLRSLFKGDMVVQGRVLMTMIETAVENAGGGPNRRQAGPSKPIGMTVGRLGNGRRRCNLILTKGSSASVTSASPWHRATRALRPCCQGIRSYAC